MAKQPAQIALFSDLVAPKDEWRLHWRGMPEFVQDDLGAAATTIYQFPGDPLYVHHPTKDDQRRFKHLVQESLRDYPGQKPEALGRAWLSKVVGYEIPEREDPTQKRGRTQAVWYPDPGSRGYVGKAYANVSTLRPGDRVARRPDGETPVPWETVDWAGTPRETTPRHPVYIISKGRWEPGSHDTPRALDRIGVPYRIVVEPQERDLYARRIPEDRILVLPFSNLGLGGIPARNWVWDHAVAEGRSSWHWIMDDNIRQFYRLSYNLKTPVADGTIFRVAEDFVDRYSNVAEFGLNYFMFASQDTVIPPYYANARVYSCICLRNDLPYRWRGRYNEDTDLSLRILKDGHATVLFNAFLAEKATTLTMKGGNTDQLYAGAESTLAAWEKHRESCGPCLSETPWLCDEARGILEPDGRWRMALSLYEQHPERTKITRKWGRWQHQVDYDDFTQKLVERPGAIPPEGIDNCGMLLRISPPEQAAPRPEIPPRGVPVVTAPRSEPSPPTFSTGPIVMPTMQVSILHQAPAVVSGWEPDPLPDLSRVRGPIGFDTETTGLRWWRGDRPVGASLAWWEGNQLRSCYLPTGHRGGNLDPETYQRWASSEEGLRGKQLVGLNIRFDAHMEREAGVDLARLGVRLTDIAHLAALLDDHRREFGLEKIANELLGEGKLDDGLDKRRMAEYHASQVAPYARKDAELPLRCLAKQVPLLEAEDLIRVWELEDRVAWATIEMERNGFPIDVEKLRAWDVETANEVRRLATGVQLAVGFAANPESPSDLERLFAERKLTHLVGRTEPTERYPNGQPSYTAEVMDAAAKADPSMAKVRELALLLDYRSRYIEPYVRGVSQDGVMRYSLHQLRGDEGGTISGRYSASRPIKNDDEGCNPQQVEKTKTAEKRRQGRFDARELYQAARGRRLVSADAEQIEYRIFAHMANPPQIIEAYRKDKHTNFHKIVEKEASRFAGAFAYDQAKILNFMLLFGGGVGKTAEQLGVSIERAREFVEVYRKAVPEARALLDLASKTARERGFIKTLLGRRARFRPCPKHGWQGSKKACGGCPRLHKALNSAVQGSAADYNKMKLAELYEERERLGLTMRLTVHDEVVGDVADDGAAEAIKEVLERQTLPLRVPLLWSVGTGANWAEAK